MSDDESRALERSAGILRGAIAQYAKLKYRCVLARNDRAAQSHFNTRLYGCDHRHIRCALVPVCAGGAGRRRPSRLVALARPLSRCYPSFEAPMTVPTPRAVSALVQSKSSICEPAESRYRVTLPHMVSHLDHVIGRGEPLVHPVSSVIQRNRCSQGAAHVMQRDARQLRSAQHARSECVPERIAFLRVAVQPSQDRSARPRPMQKSSRTLTRGCA